MEYIFALAGGFVLGGIITWLALRGKEAAAKGVAEAIKEQNEKTIAQLTETVSELEEEVKNTRTEAKDELDGIREKHATELEALREKQKGELSEVRENLAEMDKARAMAETRLEEAQNRISEERELLKEAEEKLTNTFDALAKKTLDANTKSFIALANENFGKSQETVKGIISPISDTLKKFDQKVQDLELNRKEAYSKIYERLNSVNEAQAKLSKETNNLVTALRTPHVRGRWGENTLKRVVELSGMSEYCDFTEQLSVDAEESRIRPDMIVHIPGGGSIIVDAKVSLDAYLKALEAEDEHTRAGYLAKHSSQIREHMQGLGKKSYWTQFSNSPDFVVMFIPGESFFAQAVEHDHNLIEDGMKKRVVLATPTTLLALLHAVSYGWNQEQIAKNAQQINELGNGLYKRMSKLGDHLAGIGKGLESANKSYNNAVGSLESRVLPTARKFKELGVSAAEKDIPQVLPTESSIRPISAPELREDD